VRGLGGADIAIPRAAVVFDLGEQAGSAQRGWMQPYRSELPEVYPDYIGFEDEARSISNCEWPETCSWSRKPRSAGIS
jgi:hypothetical protein